MHAKTRFIMECRHCLEKQRLSEAIIDSHIKGILRLAGEYGITDFEKVIYPITDFKKVFIGDKIYSF